MYIGENLIPCNILMGEYPHTLHAHASQPCFEEGLTDKYFHWSNATESL